MFTKHKLYDQSLLVKEIEIITENRQNEMYNLTKIKSKNYLS